MIKPTAALGCRSGDTFYILRRGSHPPGHNINAASYRLQHEQHGSLAEQQEATNQAYGLLEHQTSCSKTHPRHNASQRCSLH